MRLAEKFSSAAAERADENRGGGAVGSPNRRIRNALVVVLLVPLTALLSGCWEYLNPAASRSQPPAPVVTGPAQPGPAQPDTRSGALALATSGAPPTAASQSAGGAFQAQPAAPPASQQPSQIGGTFRGTGVFVNQAPTLPQVQTQAGGGVTLNFVDTDIREVVKVIVGDTLGENFTIDPRIQGIVTLQTSRPVPRDNLLGTLEQVLDLNGAALVRVNDLYRVVPASDVIHSTPLPISEFGKTRAAGSGISVVPLKFIAAAEMQKVLEPLAPPGAVIRVDSQRNVLLIAGSRNERANLVELVRLFDLDWMTGMSFAIYPVQSATAEVVAGELEQIFGTEDGPIGDLVRFVPIERINAVMVMSTQPSYLDRARTWIKRLDVGEGAEPRIYVYFCQNTRAVELAEVLGQIFGSPPATGLGLAAASQNRSLADLGNTLGSRSFNRSGFDRSGFDRSGFDRSGFNRGRRGFGDAGINLAEIDESVLQTQLGPQTAPGAAETPAQPTQPTRPTATLPRRSPGATADQEGGEPDIRIIPDPTKNALVILATPDDYRRVEAALRQLDIQSLQVLIEATFVEVGLTDSLEFGTEWAFSVGGGQVTFNDSDTGNGPTDLSPVSGFFNWFLSTQGGDVQVALRALQQVTEVNLLSSPNLLVLDNQTARIQIGDEVPVLTRTQTSDEGTAVTSNIEFRETGTILSVTPRVNTSGLVTLEIEQEVSNVSENEGVEGNPIFVQRTAQSTIAVHDGESVVLGGQIFEDTSRSDRGVPFLSQLPIVGFLFGTQETNFTKRELLVILTPRVIRDAVQARAVTDELSRRMQQVQPVLQEFRIRAPRTGG